MCNRVYLSTDEVREAARETCEKLGCSQLAEQIIYEFSNKMTSAMGYAKVRCGRVQMQITLSAPLFIRASIEQRLETIVHEVCHIADHYFHGKMDGHGWKWKMLMIKAGYKNPRRCHNVDNSGLRRKVDKRVVLVCACKEGCPVGPVVYKRIAQGCNGYRCRICRSKLDPSMTHSK